LKLQRLHRIAMGSVAALLPLVVLTGCGSDEKSDIPSTGGKKAPSSSAKKPGGGEPEDGVLKFVRCLRQNGLTVDDPAKDGNLSIQVTETQDQAKIDKARNACKQFMDQGGSGGGGAASGGKESEERKVWRLKVEKCMRAKGFDMGNVKENQKAEHEKASKECYKEAGPLPDEGQ
jgi:hypothetical protein